MSSDVTEECDQSTSYQLWNSLDIAVGVITIILSFFLLYQFVTRSTKHEKEKHAIRLYYVILLMSIISILALFQITMVNTICMAGLSTAVTTTRLIAFIFFITQLYLYLFSFFLIVYFIFIDSAHQLSSCTITSMFIMFISGFISLFFTLIILFIDGERSHRFALIQQLLGLWTVVMCVLLMIWLEILFVTKLVKLYKLSRDNTLRGKFLTVTTKTTLLLSVSLILTVMDMAMNTIRVNSNDNHMYFGLVQLMCILDVFSNYFCVLLSQTVFKSNYKTLCGGIHPKCTLCLKHCIESRQPERERQYTTSDTVPNGRVLPGSITSQQKSIDIHLQMQ